MRTAVRNLPILLLLGALLLLDAVLVVQIANRRAHYVSPMSSVLFLSLAYSQAWLLGLWAAIGKTRLAIRLPLVVAALAGWGQLIVLLLQRGAVDYLYFDDHAVLLMPCIAGGIAILVGIQRGAGSADFVQVGEPTDRPAIGTASTGIPVRRFQFTISELLQLVVGCGATLSIVKFFYPAIDWPPSHAIAAVFAYGAMYAYFGRIALWAILSKDFRIWRLGVLGALPWIMIVLFAFISYDRTIGVWPFLGLVAGSLLVCRTCGYRLIEEPRKRPTAARD